MEKERVVHCKSLDELFHLWKEEHSAETPDSLIKTFPKKGKQYPDDTFKTSWTEDGPLGDIGTEIENLFILKESNHGECIEPATGDFWVKEKAIKLNSHLPRRLKMLSRKCLQESIFNVEQGTKR